MKLDEVPRFDHLWASMLRNHAKVVKHLNGVANAHRLYRRAAYRFARDLLTIREHHPNEFLDHVRSTGMDVDDWIDQHFDPIEQLGGDRRDIFAMIKQGVTEEEYERLGILAKASGRKTLNLRVAKADTDTEPAPAPEMSDEEKARFWKERYEAARSELRQIRREWYELKQEVELWRKTAAKAERKHKAV